MPAKYMDKGHTADGGDNWTDDTGPPPNQINSEPSGEDQISGPPPPEHPPVPGTPAPTPKG